MDETVAKREARRRRILENSERRLQRITGKNNIDQFEDVSNKVTASLQSNLLNLEANGLSINKAFIEEENDTIHLQGDSNKKHQESPSVKSCFGLSNEDTSSVISNSYKYNDIINDKYDCTNKNTNVKHLSYDDESTEYLQEKNIASYQVQPNICNKRLLSCNVLSNHISYIILAAIVNVLLMCKMDYLFGKGIIVPYFIVMLARLYTYANIQESQHGSFFIATLILCNIKPELAYRLTWAVSIFNIVVTDLALYIFSFTLIYYAITYYFQDFNILIASSM